MSSKPKASKRPPAQPKQPLPTSEKLKRLFVSLCAQIDGGHFKNALKTCEKILALDGHDREALHAKLFLLLQTEQYTKALALVDSMEDAANYAYERAYIYYCLQQEADAEEVLQPLDKEENKGVAHLEAQVNYRKGSYEAACEMYSYLLDTSEPNTEEYADIQNNLHASQKLLDFVSSGYLRSLDKLPASVSNNLETSLPPQVPTLNTVVPKVVVPKDTEESRPKKARKSRVPTGVVPGVTPPPDPERWLKKSERTTFSTGKRRKGGAAGGATQGSVESAPAPSTPSKNTGAKGKKRK